MAGIYTASWDRVRGEAAFSVDGLTSTTPDAAPRFLPGGTLVAAATTSALSVQFVQNAGSPVVVGSASYFPLSSGGIGLTRTLTITAGSVGYSGPVTATLSVATDQPGLAPSLFADLTAGATLYEIDIVAADASGSADVGVALHSVVGGGVTIGANGTVGLSATGTSATTVATPIVPGDTATAPHAPDLFVRLVLTNGQTITIDGAQYFQLTGFTETAGHTVMSGGTLTTTLGDLTLSLGGGLANTLLADLGSGTRFSEIDVLGYRVSGTASTLMSEASFANVTLTTLDLGTGSALDLTLSYLSSEQRVFDSTGSTAIASASWNTTSNAAGFGTNGGTPRSAPATETGLGLPGGGVASGVAYYVQLVNSSGGVITFGGQSLFEIEDYSFGAQTTTNATSTVTVFSPLSITFVDPALDTTLFAVTAGGTALEQINILGYGTEGQGAGKLFIHDSFGLVGGTGFTLDAGGSVTYTANVGVAALASNAISLQGTLVAEPSGTWDAVTRNTAWLPSGAGSAPLSANPTLNSGTANTEGADVAAYYLRFVNSAGGVTTIDGSQLFALTGSLFGLTDPTVVGSATITAGKAVLQPFTLSLADTGLAPSLLAYLTAGTTLGEVDVLGYDTATGTLLSDTSFGVTQATQLTVSDVGTLRFTGQYSAIELQQHSVNAGGTLIADTPAKWNGTTNTATFSNVAGTAPVSAPATLPTSGVDTAAPTIDYYARFITASGSTITLDGNQLFALSGYSASANDLVGAGGATHVSLGALSLSLAEPELAPGLFGDVTQHTTLAEIDVLGYVAGSGALASEASFGFVVSTAIATDLATGAQITAQFGASELQQFGSGGTQVANSAWNQIHNDAIFSTTTANTAVPAAAAPKTLPASGVATATPGAIDYYARFILGTGATLQADGAQLFGLTDFSVGAEIQSTASATPTLEPLTLSLGQPALIPQLASVIIDGGLITEVDVLGYSSSSGLLVAQDSFGLAGVGSVSLSAAGTMQYVVGYGAEEMQYGANGLTLDPGPGVATGTLTIKAGLGENVTALIDSLITPGLPGDTETITAVTGHASLSAGVVTYTAPAAPGSDSFTYTVADEFGSHATGTIDVTVQPLCFCAGTRIATPAGEVPVEALRAGDLVRLADGGVAAVRWRGRQWIGPGEADPVEALPVRVRAGALGPGLPTRDLLVSPGHALRIGEMLVQAGALVNGNSIVRADAWPAGVAYYHVELDRHALLLAEGVAAESFLGHEGLPAFDNEAERDGRPFPAEMPYPRVKAARQVPAALRARLAAWAALVGGRYISAAAPPGTGISSLSRSSNAGTPTTVS